MKCWALTTLAIAVAVAAPASAQQLPNDTDLRAAYCARLLTKQIEAHEEFMAIVGDVPDSAALRTVRAEARDREDRRMRLLAYLEPRLKHLDVAPLLAASKMSDADTETAGRLLRDAGCLDKEMKAAAACSNSALASSSVRRRQERCESLDWLPF